VFVWKQPWPVLRAIKTSSWGFYSKAENSKKGVKEMSEIRETRSETYSESL